MSDFTAPLLLTPGRDGLWLTGRAFEYEIGRAGSGLKVTVPSGFSTDLGTIPRGLRWIINPADGECAAAFVLHDFLCADVQFTRSVTDAILFEALGVLSVPVWKAALIYSGVSVWRVIRYLKVA